VPRLIGGREDALSSDGFHPSVIGYDAWAEVIFQALGSGPAARSTGSDPSLEAAGA